MKRSHSRQAFPLEKGPSRSVRKMIRVRGKQPGGLAVVAQAGTLSERVMSKAWQGIKRLQTKKRRMSIADQFGIAFAAAAQERAEAFA